MAFDRKTTIAFNVLGRKDGEPLKRQTIGANLDLFFRPHGASVLVGAGPSYLVFDRRVSREDAVAAFRRGVRTAPEGAASDIRPGIPLARAAAPSAPATAKPAKAPRARAAKDQKPATVIQPAALQTPAQASKVDFDELFQFSDKVQSAAA